MRYIELDGKSEKELHALIAEGRARIHTLRLSRSMNQLKDVREIREKRKDTARMLTKLSASKK